MEKESYDSKAEGTGDFDMHDSAIHNKMSEALGKSEKRKVEVTKIPAKL